MNRALIFPLVLLLSFDVFAEELEKILRREDGKAEATCSPVTERSSTCVVKVPGAEVDVSGAEGANLGKLGMRERSAYQKVVSFPSKWLWSAGDEHMVEITTQAWFEGQRYTVTEPAYIKNGKYQPR